MDVLWLTAGLGCDGETISITAATQPGLEELMFGALPWVPKIRLHKPFLAFETGDDFLAPFYRAAPVLIPESDIATHLYHIAQEAVNNALKHGRPRRIAIRLAGGSEGSFLRVDDDGVGVHTSPGDRGMGLSIMSYRAKMIGGALDVRPGQDGGTTVCCTFSASNLE